MAKKFVRGVTGVDDIESFDKTLTNVNDLISDGQNTYVHTKKGKVESYYNLTDNIKKVQANGETITVEKSDDGTVNLKVSDKFTNRVTSLESDVDGLQNDYISNVNTSTGYIMAYKSGNVITLNELNMIALINTKQNTLTNNTSIGVSGSGLQQLYALKQTYNVSGGLLKTHVKIVAQNTSISSAEEEFNFIVKIDNGVSSVNFTLNEHDTTKFTKIMTTYGSNNTVRISGCVFTLSGSTLTVSTTNNTNQNYVITFSDII